MRSRVLVGDCLELLALMAAKSVDAIITDPPYHLTAGKKGGSGDASVNLKSPYGRSRVTTGFMGKKWDGGDVAFRAETWAAQLRVAKPGAHLVAFGSPRTEHRLVCAIEDAGWEIRDKVMWLYGSGFPKSLKGPWGGTALKPGWEPIIIARRPLEGTLAKNFARYGTGGLNIDACRIPTADDLDRGVRRTALGLMNDDGWQPKEMAAPGHPLGRWPANVALDELAAIALDAMSGKRGAASPESTAIWTGRKRPRSR